MGLLDPDIWSAKVWSSGWTKSNGGDYPVVEPATGEELARLGFALPPDVTMASEIAASRQREWAAAPFSERARVLRQAADIFATRGGELVPWIVRETGGVPFKAGFELHVATNECLEAAALPSRPYGELLPSEAPRLSFARRLPAGVVGVIAPFNFPLILSIRAVAPALALGNAVVLKPDPRTGVAGGVILARVFEEAGLPDGLFHVLPGGAAAGEALVTDPHVRVVAFTGSSRVGRIVARLAGEHLKRAHLELGGNSALVILDDVDVEAAAAVGAFGSFFHQGQICMTTGRHLVSKKIAKRYIEALSEKANRLSVGNPTEDGIALGPVIDATQRDRIHSLVTRSVEMGATLSAGGTYDRLFYRPTVLTDVTPDTPAYAEEVFGPVAPVTTFSSIEEAAQLAATSEYGLSLGVLSRDPLRALELAELVPSGAVHINDQTVNDEAQIPFGGVGISGTGGRLGGAGANVEAFTETQWVTMRGGIAPSPY
jgi:benzaldehyde dehydrogenase (NAD)